MEAAMEFFDSLFSQGYELREGQSHMALDIIDSMKANQNIVVEAGVGIGKSFAYLIPMVLYNRRFKRPILIATSSIALQEQLISDVEILSDLLEYKPFVILAKGMRNYACRRKCLELSYDKSEKGQRVLELLNVVREGYIDKAKLPEVSDEIWESINAESCNSMNCRVSGKCKFIEERNQLKDFKGIIITNQDMLIKNLQNRIEHNNEIFNRDIKYLVVDEGHNLEEKVRAAYTYRWTKSSLRKDINELYKSIDKSNSIWGIDVTFTIDLVNEVFALLNRDINNQISKYEQGNNQRHFFNKSPELDGCLRNLKRELDDLVLGSTFSNHKIKNNENGAGKNILDFINFIEDLENEDKDLVKWLIRTSKDAKGVSIEACPKDISIKTRELFFDDSSLRTIITSATLTHNNSKNEEERYSYFIKNNGFPSGDLGFLSPPKDSTFKYKEKAIIYVSESLPLYQSNKNEFIESSICEILSILSITEGKSLILFTSKEDMREVYSRLGGLNLPWKLLMQEGGSSQEETLNKFKLDINSVLLGTGLFWEGISIEGESLSSVIIYRLPFPVPDPVIKHKCKIASDGMNEVLLPQMIIKLKQGIGRLIRNDSDYGIVAILDSRLGKASDKSYKEIVWSALPIKNRTYELHELKDYYEELQKNYSK